MLSGSEDVDSYLMETGWANVGGPAFPFWLGARVNQGLASLLLVVSVHSLTGCDQHCPVKLPIVGK
jgi:hypothetical protein